MNDAQCPVCYGPLEVREVTPCFICGGWPASVARFDPNSEFVEFRLPDGRLLTLCAGCRLEEFMVSGGWGYRLIPGETLPVSALARVRDIKSPSLELDKYCKACNLRLAFAKVVSSLDC
jgi:hypothetical protein